MQSEKLGNTVGLIDKMGKGEKKLVAEGSWELRGKSI